MTNEPLVERNRQLERSVKRWRLICLVLAGLLICVLAIGGILTAIPATQGPSDFWLWLPWVRAARAAEMRAMQEQMRAVEAEKRAVEARKEHKKRAEDERP
jgi:hypothetical protein